MIKNNSLSASQGVKINLTILMVGFFLIILLILPSVYASPYPVSTPINLEFTCTINNAIPSGSATYNFSINYPNGTKFLSWRLATPSGQGHFNYTATFPITGHYVVQSTCIDGSLSYSDDEDVHVTPNGKEVQDTGQVSMGLLYFIVIIGFGLVIMGYLFLGRDNLWLSYFGLFLMLFGSIFLYYSLHLSNLYAETIAYESGAITTTTGAFKMVSTVIKLTPYLVVLIVVASIIKLLRTNKKKKQDNDGWDDNKY